jgi:alcohol dehydrogenase
MMSATQVSSFFCPTKIFLGVNSHEKLEEIIKGLNCSRLFITVDAALLQSELYRRVSAILGRCKVAASVFSDMEPDPSAHTVAKAFEACRSINAEAILAIGGGSTMDVAKAVGILATNGGCIHDYEGIEKFSTPPLPRIAIPTTAGTGSEVSGSCVITDTEKNLKMSIRHAALNPADAAILDPVALKTVPVHVAAHSGMDAFVHAFESYLSVNASPMTDALNLHALELLSRNIRQFVANRNNMDAGLNMLCGSSLAGMTFGITGLGNVHCMARFVGAYFHVSHGLSNAICLPTVADFNLPANPKKYARVAAAMGRFVDGMPELDAAAEATQAIRALCRDLDIPERLRDIGAGEDKLAEMAQLCVEANYNRWNPRHTTYHDFLTLFQKAY